MVISTPPSTSDAVEDDTSSSSSVLVARLALLARFLAAGFGLELLNLRGLPLALVDPLLGSLDPGACGYSLGSMASMIPLWTSFHVRSSLPLLALFPKGIV